MNKEKIIEEEEIEDLADELIGCLGRNTVDKFIEDENGDLVEIQTYSLYAVAEELYKRGWRKVIEKIYVN